MGECAVQARSTASQKRLAECLWAARCKRCTDADQECKQLRTTAGCTYSSMHRRHTAVTLMTLVAHAWRACTDESTHLQQHAQRGRQHALRGVLVAPRVQQRRLACAKALRARPEEDVALHLRRGAASRPIVATTAASRPHTSECRALPAPGSKLDRYQRTHACLVASTAPAASHHRHVTVPSCAL
jgi:hypothetical protein